MRSAAFLPTTRMAAAVHDSDRRDMILGYHVVDDIRESPEWRFVDVIDRDGALLGITFDQFQRGSDGGVRDRGAHAPRRAAPVPMRARPPALRELGFYTFGVALTLLR
jgi:hypothetical protein